MGRENELVVMGRKPVIELLRDDLADVDCIYLKPDAHGSVIGAIRKLSAKRSIPVKIVPDKKLSRMAGRGNHQGVIAVVSPMKLADLDDVLRAIAPTRDDVVQKKPLLLIPARVGDPYNLGAIIRSAVAFGCDAVLLPDRDTAPMNATALKASAGTALRIPFARVPNILEAIRNLKERGYWVAGLSGHGGTKISEMDWDRPLVLLIGSESSGLTESLEKSCDYLVSIAINQNVESLNASVAAGIALQAAGRQH